MTEPNLQYLAAGKILWCGFYSLFYGLGGTEGFGKWIRRYVGPLWMGLGLWMFASLQGTFKPLQLLYPLLLCASSHLGYGGDNVKRKIIRRSIYGLAIAIASLPLAVISGLWLLYCIHAVVCVSMSVLLGVANPCASARDEETLVACFTSVLPLFLIA